MTDKTPLILPPGLLCDEALWGHQAETLSDIADITIADLTQNDTLGFMARAVLDSAPEKFALAGLSMGGYLAQEIMRQAPERVLKLALLDTTARPDEVQQTERRRDFMSQAEEGEFKGVTRKLLPLLIHPDRLQDHALTQTVMNMAESIGKESFLRQQKAIMTRPDGRRDLGLIRCPTLVLCGRQDVLTPPEMHREIADGIPTSTLVLIEDCGHLSTLEQPHAVSAVMRYWLCNRN
jgi:pimeloyl-ACP methyl ester carboxylesterase